jgi:hypothetical protein
LFRVGLLYITQDFLKYIYDYQIKENDFLSDYSFFNNIPSKDIIKISELCGWIEIKNEEYLTITDKGIAILKQKNYQSKLRHQLKDLIKNSSTSWMPLIKQGRDKLKKYLNPDTVQCFDDANLLDNYNPDIIEWWIEISSYIYDKSEFKNFSIGIYGEKLSLKYEETRVGIKPKWISIDNNNCGYDILSQVSKKDKNQLIIEVKTSRSPWKSAFFYITQNEWLVLSIKKNAVLHLWSVSSKTKFGLLDIPALKKHIPKNFGKGEWNITKIPFSITEPLKKDIKLELM